MNINQLIDLVQKATIMTENILKGEFDHDLNILILTLDNRDRLISVLNHHFNKMFSSGMIIPEQSKQELSKKLACLDALDARLVDKLDQAKKSFKKSIAKSYKNKENFKGYNPNNVR